MTGLQLAILSGGFLGLGLSLAIAGLVPAPTHLRDAIGRLQPKATTLQLRGIESNHDFEHRIGQWAQRNLPPAIWGNPREKDLALLGRSKATFYGSKIISALIGLVVAPLLSIFLMVLGLAPPIVVPTLGSLALAALMWFLPNNELKDQARKAREEFSVALAAFVEMVALERLVGSTVPQALDHAAVAGDSWAFKRIATVLRKTHYTGVSPWEALADLGNDLDLADLVDLADIMRLGGADGTQVYDSLRARATAMRNATLNAQIARANAAAERIAVPVGLLVIVLALTLVTPAFLQMI